MNEMCKVKIIPFGSIAFKTELEKEAFNKASQAINKTVQKLNSKYEKYRNILTINELLEKYPAFSKCRIYEMLRQGLKHIKGKPILIDVKDFEDFLEEQKTVDMTTIEKEYQKKYGLLNMPKDKRKYV